jgi:lipase chaperone LimK
VKLGIPAAALGALPDSLRTSQLEGTLELDAEGHFRPSDRARSLFDYFLLASTEEPLEVIRGRIVLEIRARLPATAQEEAIAVLDRYLSFQPDAQRLTAEEGDPGRRFEQLHSLRRRALGDELASELYSDDEEKTRFELDRRRRLEDDSLSEPEREQRLQELEDRLSPEIRELRRRAEAPARLDAAVEELRANGGSAEAIFALREQAYGRAAAEEFGVLDAERERWQQRWDGYRAQRKALADKSLLAEERQAGLEDLRRGWFLDDELARVQTLEATEASSRNTPEPP